MIKGYESTFSFDKTLDYLSNRLILMSLNIHIELNDGRFSFENVNEIRKQSDLSVVSSSMSNALIDQLISSIEYYCHEIDELIRGLRSIIYSLSVVDNSMQIINDVCKGSSLCLNALHNYRHDRIEAVKLILENPYREDAWCVVHEIDSNIFSKCRIVLIRLRIYFLLTHQVLKNVVNR